MLRYPLVMTNIAVAIHHVQWKIKQYKWSFSVAMLNYHRVIFRTCLALKPFVPRVANSSLLPSQEGIMPIPTVSCSPKNHHPSNLKHPLNGPK